MPEALLKGCKGIAIFPHVVKGAFTVGARYGKGVVVCRDSAGCWSPPAFFTLVGGSVGWQIGAEATDVVLVFMTTRGTRSLLESQFTLGGSLSVAAGPIGRSAEASTDAKFNAEIYSYAKSKGAYCRDLPRRCPDRGRHARAIRRSTARRCPPAPSCSITRCPAPAAPEVGRLLAVLPMKPLPGSRAAACHASPPRSPSPVAAALPPSPRGVPRLRVGADRKLADYEQIACYFEALDQASDRVAVPARRKTTQGRGSNSWR